MKELSENNLVCRTNFKVTSADTDMEARLRPGALINYLIQSAINSADQLGFGFSGLQQQQLFWVLSRMTVEIYEPVKWYDEIIVDTWPKDIEKIIYLRDFLVKRKSGEIIAKATSGWLAIDVNTKRPKIVDGLYTGIFKHLKDKHALNEPPEKLSQQKAGEEFIINTTYFDIDLNKHVTSSRYIDWMMDTFPVDFHKNNYPWKISINYIKETMPGEKILLLRTQPNEKDFLFEGFHSSSSNSAYRGKLEF